MLKVISNIFIDPNLIGINSDIEFIKIKNLFFKCQKVDSLINEIAIGKFIRETLRIIINQELKIDEIELTKSYLPHLNIFVDTLKSKDKIIITDKIIEEIKTLLLNIPIQKGHIYSFSTLKLSMDDTELGFINKNTKINIIALKPDYITVESTQPLFKADFDFSKMNIGGLNKEFEVIFRRAFATRLVSNQILKNLGINHVKGMLLYGPPGCGKTLIARQIGKLLNCEETKIVNGPELINGLVGKSEENVRDLFSGAIANPNKFYLIICDEFDAIASKRGSGSGVGGELNDSIVNQFLSMIDGPKSLNNIFLICMTNRKSSIDEALLRSGRLEIQLEINLPDQSGREEILSIHTKKIREIGYCQDIDLKLIAQMTINYTGAELEGLIRQVCQYAITKNIDFEDLESIRDINPTITQDLFSIAIEEFIPQFGNISNEIDIMYREPRLDYTDFLNKIKNASPGNIYSLLIIGNYRSGKTSLASYLAKKSNYDCIKFINAEKLLKHEYKHREIYNIFEDGCKSKRLLIIFDSIERIIEYLALRVMVNNDILQTIYAIMNAIIAFDKSIVIIFTSSNQQLMNDLEFTRIVTDTIMI